MKQIWTKLTDNKWLNLFKTPNKNGKDYFFVSRRNEPATDDSVDAVVIVPFIIDPENRNHKMVLTYEYRPAINGWEYGFPAGLVEKDEDFCDAAKREMKEETGLDVDRVFYISPTIYSSAGLTDENVKMVFVSVNGDISEQDQEEDEQIEAVICSPEDVEDILNSGEKIGAKAWPVMDYFAHTGRVWNS